MNTEATQQSEPVTLTLKLSEDERQVLGVIPAGNGITPLKAVDVKRLLKAEGYAQWRWLDTGIAKVCSLLGKSPDNQEVPVAECLDGELNISVSKDALQAFMSITPPQGGKPVDRQMIQQALEERGINHGILPSALRAEVMDKQLIAQGERAVDGDDTRFESLLPQAPDKRPTINADDTVDYREIGAFITVEAGDALMRKHPATPGTNGCDIHGNVLTAKPGRELPFASKLSGTEVDSEDLDLLRASIGGQPEIVDRGMTVNPVIRVDNVDLSTGNIHFDGTVNVRGDVAEGLHVHATGDIYVSGMVEGADLVAGGDIAVSRGVVGRGEVKKRVNDQGRGIASLKSGGSIKARFIENAVVEATNTIQVGELVTHSKLMAFNSITVGRKGARKGHIIGGTTKATLSITAQVIGSQANVPTVIEVGADPKLHDEIRKCEADLARQEPEYKKLSAVIARLRSKTNEPAKETLDRIFATLKQLDKDINKARQRLSRLKARYELIEKAQVNVGKQVYPNTQISIGDESTVVRHGTNAGSYALAGTRIAFTPT